MLVADDYPDLAELLAEVLGLLSPIPLEIHVAHDGQAAVAKAVEMKPCLVILDIDMPVMSGLDAATRMRELLTTTPLLVAVTGHPDNLPRLKERQVFDVVMTKPVVPEKVLALLSRARDIQVECDSTDRPC